MKNEVPHSKVITIIVETTTHERILNAYKHDTQRLLKQPIDFNQWAVNCLLDWVEAVEIEATRNG
jgi:hypothetical protein